MRRGIGLGTSIFLLCLILMFFGKAFAQPQVLERPLVPLEVEKYVPGEIIVKFKPGVRDEVISELNRRLGTSVLYTSPFAGFKRLKIPKGKTVEDMVNIYKRNPNVKYAEPNFIVYAFLSPEDEYYPYQWHLDDTVAFDIYGNLIDGTNPYGGENGGGINVEPAWEISTGSGVTVAIIDTGIAYENYGEYEQASDLAGTCFWVNFDETAGNGIDDDQNGYIDDVNGWDFINSDSHPNDDNGHGTHIAGTVAQSTNNNIGVAGVAFDACLMPVKVLDQNGSGTYGQVADGISYAANNGANVINLSLGGSDPSFALEEALEDAYKKGVTIVAAAGNDGSNTLSYPAAYDAYVIAVGATRYDETLAYYSNYGSSLDLVAPGGDLNVDQNYDGYGDGVLQQTFIKIFWWTFWDYYFMQGTSMAAPHVAGVAALLIANENATTPDEVRAALQQTAEDLGPTGFDETYGWGLVDAAAALGYTPGPVPNQPPVADAGPDQTLSDSDGDGVESVTLDGSGSYDPDGTISSYEWTEEGVKLGTGKVITYDFPVGNHTVTLTVTDDQGATASDKALITVSANQDPIADAGPDQTVSDSDGDGVESVTLDGSGSYDPDGTISSYEWTEEGVKLGTGEVITYDFAVGNHTVTLTVTDNGGAIGQDEAIVTITEKPAQLQMYVGDIEMSGSCIGRGRWTWCRARATVTILDSSKAGLEGAEVSGSWSGAYTEDVSGTTDADGKVTFETSLVKGGGTFTFTVDNVTKKDWSYNQDANVETSDSITAP